MQQSKIEWTDVTWNPVRGCTKISPGCKNCYAETFAERWRGVPGHPYEFGFDLRLIPKRLLDPLKWQESRMVFVNSMSDLFHERVPDDYIDQVYAVMALTQEHTYQVLTKRPKRMREWYSRPDLEDRIYQQIEQIAERADLGDWIFDVWPLPNVWLGASVEDQQRAYERINLLEDCPARIRFLSAEPLLGEISFEDGPLNEDESEMAGWSMLDMGTIHWVIVGGESGQRARPCDLTHIRTVVRQCQEARVPVFVKQLGSNPIVTGQFDLHSSDLIDGPIRLRDRKGGDPSEWPEDVRVREMPT